MRNIIIFMLFMSFGFLNGADFKMKLPLIDKKPSLDGNINPEEWEKASCVSGFSSTDEEWPANQTCTLAMTDGKMLYLAFRCYLPDAARTGEYEAGSTKVFGEESVEFFIAPDEKSNTYYHFCVNASGSRYTARCADGGRDVSWQPEMKIAAGKFKGGWTLETAIPLESMKATMEEGKKIKLNFGRNCFAAGRVTSSWTGQSDFNKPELFGEAVVSKNGGINFAVERLESGQNAKFILANTAGNPVVLSVNLKCRQWTDNKKITMNSPSSNIVITEKLPATGDLELDISAPDFKFSKKCQLPHSAKSFAVKPELYYCPSDKKDMPIIIEKRPENCTLLDLTLGDGKEIILKQALKENMEKTSFDISGLKEGRYSVSATCKDAKGQELAVDEKIFFIKTFKDNAMPEKQDFSISGSVIKMNGEPFFPFMRSSSNTAKSPLEKDAFNVKYGTGERVNAPFFDTCGVPSKLLRQPFLCYQLPSDEDSFSSIAKSFAKPGNFVFRRLQYEIGIKLCNLKLEELDRVEEYGKFYKYIKEKFPSVSVSIHYDGREPEELNKFTGGYDILEIASWKSSYAKNPVKNLAADLQSAKKLSGGKPLILWLGASIPHNDYRNSENIRAAAYLSIMHGANGIIFHMGHEGIPAERTRLWSVFRGLADEMEYLYPIIINGRKLQAGEIKTSAPDLDCLGLMLDKKLYIMAVNTSLGTVKAEIEVKEKFSALTMPFEKNRKAVTRDGKIEDSFSTLEPHLYILELE